MARTALASPGSSWDYDNIDNRYNQSVDLTYSGGFAPLNADINAQIYYFNDVDELLWGFEIAGFNTDDNFRRNSAWGARITPHFQITPTTALVTGVGHEQSKLRSTRVRSRVDGAATTQIAPYDNNQDFTDVASFLELTQGLFDDRLTLRGGWRHSWGELQLRPAPNIVLTSTETREIEFDTYSAGVTFRLLDDLNLRAGYATGFRAPFGSELAGQFSAVLTPNAITRSNPNLEPETSEQIEVGFTWAPTNLFLDVAVFDNSIFHRITSVVIDPRGPGTADDISQPVNAPGAARVQGIEAQLDYNIGPMLGMAGQSLILSANGSYNFKMQADEIDRTRTGLYREMLQRFYEWQGSFNLAYEAGSQWGLDVTDVLRGPMYYDTEENLLIPAGEPANIYVHKKDEYWLWRACGHYNVMPNVELFAGVNNILDVNEHATFIAIDEQPYISNPTASNGGRANSMPGHNFYAGARLTF